LYSLNPTSSAALHLFGTKWSKTLEEKSYHTAEVYFYKLVGVLLIKQLTQHMSYTKGIRRRHPSYLCIISIPYNLLFNHCSSLPCTTMEPLVWPAQRWHSMRHDDLGLIGGGGGGRRRCGQCQGAWRGGVCLVLMPRPGESRSKTCRVSVQQPRELGGR
jgi:hypothetical protein